MKIDTITLYCANCDPADWVDINSKLVHISLDLQENHYRFTS